METKDSDLKEMLIYLNFVWRSVVCLTQRRSSWR